MRGKTRVQDKINKDIIRPAKNFERMFEFDLNEIKKEDLSFETSFPRKRASYSIKAKKRKRKLIFPNKGIRTECDKLRRD